MNGTGGKATLAENVLNEVAIALGLDEDEDETLLNREEETHELVEFVVLFDVLHALDHVLGSGSDAADGEEDVVTHEVSGKALDVGRERGREHHGLTIFSVGHSLLLDDATDLGFESHIQHAIGFVEDEELDIFHGETATLDEVYETSGSGDEEIAPPFDLAELVADVGSSIDADGGDAGAVEELLGLVLNLGGQLPGGCQDQALGICPPSSDSAGGFRSAVPQHGDDDGEQESSGLSGPGLGTRHEIPVRTGDGDGILLHRSGLGVPA